MFIIKWLNIGARVRLTKESAHGPLDFCRVKRKVFGPRAEIFRWAQTTSGSSLGAPKNRCACRKPEIFSSPATSRSWMTTKPNSLGSKMSQISCTFCGKKSEARVQSKVNRCHVSVGTHKFKAGVNMNLSEILLSLKRDWKGKRVMEHHRCVSTNF